MLTEAENELLTRTAPGTPMGNLLRRYWIPALLSEELPEPDCPPVRVKLLGEDLVAFRDTTGRVGLLDAYCAHRRANLFWGRNEECGLRCVYHGWKYDVAGNCVDMPNEPPESRFKEKITLTAYPCEERGGVVWAYMGPPELRPGLPELEWATLPPAQVYRSKRLQECNWLQAMEGGIDSSHISFLHRDVRPIPPGQSASGGPSEGQELVRRDTSPQFEVKHVDYGLLIGARRNADEDHHYWRITQWLMPWYTMIPPFGDRPIGGHAWVPIDDGTCWAWSIDWHPARELTDAERADWKAGAGVHIPVMPGTYLPALNKSNNYGIDRQLQKSGRSFTGIPGIAAQDVAVQESMGEVCDRTREHLGTSDTAIIATRRMLLHALNELQDGQDLPALDPSAQRVRSASLLLPKGVPFDEGAKEALTARPDGYVVAV